TEPPVLTAEMEDDPDAEGDQEAIEMRDSARDRDARDVGMGEPDLREKPAPGLEPGDARPERRTEKRPCAPVDRAEATSPREVGEDLFGRRVAKERDAPRGREAEDRLRAGGRGSFAFAGAEHCEGRICPEGQVVIDFDLEDRSKSEPQRR